MDFSLEAVNGAAQGAKAISSAIQGGAEILASLKALLQSPERRSDAEIEAAVTQLSHAMEHARLGNLFLDAQLALLQGEVARAQEAKEKLARYELWETQTGSFVYALRPDKAEGQPPHFICPNCYEQSKRSILQGGRQSKQCQECKATFDFAEPPPLPSQMRYLE